MMTKKILCALITLHCYIAHATYHAVYLVPWDYKGPISPYYKEWGGTKPHATIAGFAEQPKTLTTIISAIAQKSRKSGRWTLNCSRNHCKTNRGEGLVLLHFSATTVKNIANEMRKKKIKNIHNTDSTHITMCETSEKHFNTTKCKQALERARDWRLVIVQAARLNSKKIWKNNYKV